MHSRIFQVSLKPINKEDYIEESTYWEHWFVNSIADYVVDSNDRNYDINWLKNCARGYTVGNDTNGEYLIITNRTEYFQHAFNRFQDMLNAIKNSTIDDFATGIHEIWGLKNAYEDKFGFYIDADGELMTFDSFVRHCTTEEKYYIGGTVDYHC